MSALQLRPTAGLMDLPWELLQQILHLFHQDALESVDRVTGKRGFGATTDLCNIALLHSKLSAIARPMLYEHVCLGDKIKYERYAATLQGFEDQMLMCIMDCFNPLARLKRLELVGMGKHKGRATCASLQVRLDLVGQIPNTTRSFALLAVILIIQST